MFPLQQVCDLSNEVCAPKGIDPQQLRNWISADVITPTNEGELGRGKGHRFSLMQTVGLLVAQQVRNSPQGCVQSYVAKVVTAFTKSSEKWLQTELKTRGHYLASVAPSGKPWLQKDGHEFGWPNVAQIYAHVKKAEA